MKDSQRGAVYAWDEKVYAKWPDILKKKLTLSECRELIVKVYGDYRPGRTPPELRDGRGRRRAVAYGSHLIKLPVWARTVGTVLHEIAHGLNTVRPAHGKTYARQVLELYVRYGGVVRSEAKSLGVNQKPRRVRFAPPNAEGVAQIPSLKWMKWKARLEVLRIEFKEHKEAEPLRDKRSRKAAKERS